MKKVYVVIWAGQCSDDWNTDGCFESLEIAEAKVCFEQLRHPKWRYQIIRAEVPLFAKEVTA